jgi:hypothetical protein
MRSVGMKAFEKLTVNAPTSITWSVSMSKWKTAWIIMKLKVVRMLLAPILKLHIWLELKGKGQ